MFKSDVSHLGKYSRKKINLSCDKCSVEKTITYKSYTSYGYTNGDYLCRKCKLEKNNMEKYGVVNVFQLESVKQKSKETILDKYGVENVSQSSEIQLKVKNTMLERYNEYHHFKNKETYQKYVNNLMDKYGVENISQLDEIKEKKRKKKHVNKNTVSHLYFLKKDFLKN